MKPTTKIGLAVTISFLLISGIAFSQGKGARGKEKTVSDNTYGNGGFKTTFSVHGMQLILFEDANKNRRQLQNIYVYGDENKTITSTGTTYFDSHGKKSFFNLESADYNKKPVVQLQERFLDGQRQAASAWAFHDGSKVFYNYNLRTGHFDESGEFNYYMYNEQTVLFPKVNSGLAVPKFNYNLIGSEHYKAKAASSEYAKGIQTTEAYNDYDPFDGDYDVEIKKIYDKHGVLRHEWYREFYPDGCEYEEMYYYDCHGELQYQGYTWYDDEGYDYELCDEYFKDGEMVAGHYYYDGYDYGEEYTYDPVSGLPVRGWHPELNEPQDFEPDTSDCPDVNTYWTHLFYLGPSVIIEDAGAGDHFSTYGAELSYNWNPCYRGGLIGDLGVNFGKQFNTNYTKITALVGGGYYPIKTATLKDNFMFSIHGMAGITYLNSKYRYGGNSSSNGDTYFMAAAGLGFDHKLNTKFGVGLRADYVPVFQKGNTANNLRVSLGFDF